ncbi:unnamed protein product [Haemonchus placei]|uniref:Uncharacterized protein n=1 Tax=Haemonchus placei TaxID=6290 RepID=A0A0N4WWM4_HAEPC|nr:unnamed protein product [Haemonchus placei]
MMNWEPVYQLKIRIEKGVPSASTPSILKELCPDAELLNEDKLKTIEDNEGIGADFGGERRGEVGGWDGWVVGELNELQIDTCVNALYEDCIE